MRSEDESSSFLTPEIGCLTDRKWLKTGVPYELRIVRMVEIYFRAMGLVAECIGRFHHRSHAFGFHT